MMESGGSAVIERLGICQSGQGKVRVGLSEKKMACAWRAANVEIIVSQVSRRHLTGRIGSPEEYDSFSKQRKYLYALWEPILHHSHLPHSQPWPPD